MVAVEVRAGVEADLPALTDIYNHYVEHTHITFDLEPFTVEQRRSWFMHHAAGPRRLLVAVEGDELLGYATAGEFMAKAAYAPSVSTSVYCRAETVGRGIGTLLYTTLFDALAGDDVHRAYAGIALPNEASLALHHRFGFREIGTLREVGRKFGRYWDVTWLEKPLPG